MAKEIEIAHVYPYLGTEAPRSKMKLKISAQDSNHTGSSRSTNSTIIKLNQRKLKLNNSNRTKEKVVGGDALGQSVIDSCLNYQF